MAVPCRGVRYICCSHSIAVVRVFKTRCLGEVIIL